jgi:hypothetical protein
MIVPGSASPLLLSSAAGYNLTKSLRFRSSASARLTRTPASASNRRTYTISAWVKLGSNLSSDVATIFCGGDSSTSASTHLYFYLNSLRFYFGGAGGPEWTTSQVFRDYSAWYHIVAAVDTTQATFGNRLKLYINGTEVTNWSAQGTGGNTAQNSDTQINNNVGHGIGSNGAAAQYLFDGYIAEFNFIDGQQLTPSSFGQTSATTGVWIPKKFSGTYGTNGFYLKFTDTASTSALGTDFSGNSNTWTVNNISLTSGSTYDSMNDVPTLTSATTANYCVLNPLDKGTNNTLSNGNLRYEITEGQQGIGRATFGLPSTGKWYCEATKLSGGNLDAGIATRTASLSLYLGEDANGWGYFSADGKVYNNNASIATGATLADGDVLGIAFNSDTGTLQFYKNGTLQTTTTGFTLSTVQYFFAAGSFGGDGDFNFGQQPWAYTPPSGFIALNAFNLPTPTIGATASTLASKYFNANLYTGNGTTNAITNVGFQPDFVWVKSRSDAYFHGLYDAVRGAGSTKGLYSNDTVAEGTYSDFQNLVSFDSNGFTLGATSNTNNINANTSSFVGWNWKANGSGSTNTTGTITSTVSANTTSGFSIVTYTGNATSSQTVGHGLGVTPTLFILKSRGVQVWNVYSLAGGITGNTILELNSSAAANTGGNISLTASSTTIGFGSASQVNGSGVNFVAYCFAPVAGYSAFGSYTGNASTDGPFVFLGFKPAFLIIKNSTATGEWHTWDYARSPSNVNSKTLRPNNSNAETDSSDYSIDFLSNGFKIRNASNLDNQSGQTFIYMAFAEYPFKYANAR